MSFRFRLTLRSICKPLSKLIRLDFSYLFNPNILILFIDLTFIIHWLTPAFCFFMHCITYRRHLTPVLFPTHLRAMFLYVPKQLRSRFTLFSKDCVHILYRHAFSKVDTLLCLLVNKVAPPHDRGYICNGACEMYTSVYVQEDAPRDATNEIECYMILGCSSLVC
jgi:hypothetical protein